MTSYVIAHYAAPHEVDPDGFVAESAPADFAAVTEAKLFASKEAAEAAASKWSGHVLRVHRARFVPVIYHGGRLCGVGRWAAGHRHAERERAEAEGRRLSSKYRQLYGHDPIVALEIAI